MRRAGHWMRGHEAKSFHDTLSPIRRLLWFFTFAPFVHFSSFTFASFYLFYLFIFILGFNSLFIKKNLFWTPFWLMNRVYFNYSPKLFLSLSLFLFLDDSFYFILWISDKIRLNLFIHSKPFNDMSAFNSK